MPGPRPAPPAAPADALAPAPATLGERLQWARRARFVGRAAECARFERMLAGLAEPVWLLHGPGGMGKTTLLAELARRAEAAGRIVIEIDARHMADTPQGWWAALRAALPDEPTASDAAAPPLPPPGSVLLVDTCETVMSLAAWWREVELPRYPADVLVVLAGRTPADTHWRLDPGWSLMAAATRLGPWSPDEARDYLGSRLSGMPVPETLLQRGAGVPLLLALLADAHRHGQADTDAVAPPADLADGARHAALHAALVRDLVERFARELSDPALRAAFDVMIVARTVTVPMLADTVDAATASELYDWLASLPFVQLDEAGAQGGLQMHDLVREALAASWAAREPVALASAGLRVQQHLARRVTWLGRHEALRQLKDWIFVLRFTDVAPHVDHRHVEDHALHPLADEAPQVLALVRQRLGEGMAAHTAHWLQHRPEDFRLVRHRDGALAGVMLLLELAEATPEALAADPAAQRAWSWVLRERPPRPGGSVCLARLMLDARTDALPNPTVSLAGMWVTQRTLTHPRAEWNLSLHHNAEVMRPLFETMTRLNWAHREPALDDLVDGRAYGGYARDLVREPIGPEWRPARVASGTEASAPMSHEAFGLAVREAFRHWARDDALAANPLCHSRALADEQGAPASAARLRQALGEAVQALATHPADRKFHHALRLTWLDPGPTQERVAEELGLPFNTYRYHLARGAERVTQILWQRELMARFTH